MSVCHEKLNDSSILYYDISDLVSVYYDLCTYHFQGPFRWQS